MKPDISGMSDRQLLEQIFATQVILARELYRMNDSEVKKYNADLIDEEDDKDESYDKLQADIKRLLGTSRSPARDAGSTNSSEGSAII